MRTNLIQNYIVNNNVSMGAYQAPDKDRPAFSVHENLYNRTFIKPLPPTAKLVNGSIFNAPAEMVKDWAYEVKSLKDGISGKANDHELGKLNDVGMKLGGLAIAAYLAAKKSTPLTKAMEFVGFASFFASMALWPKIAIQLPAKLIHGINTRQAYEDSEGRKKPFSLDTQFLPFDLFSDKKIDKIGDWQRVPKDLPNRRDFIQEKMRMEYVQNNTLWMMTAGFATPVMSGLICNFATPYVEKILAKHDNKMNEKMLQDFPDSVEAAVNNSINNKIETFIQFNKDKPLNETVKKELTEILTANANPVLADGIAYDLEQIMKNDKYIIDNSIPEYINKKIIATLSQSMDEDLIKQIVPTSTQISEIFENGNYINKTYTAKEHRDLIAKIRQALIGNVEKYNNISGNQKLNTDFIEDLVSNVDIEADPIKKGLKHVPARTFDVNMQNTVKSIANAITNFNAKVAVLHKYAYKKVAHAADSSLAFEYNKIANKLVKILGIAPEELDNARYDRELMNNVIRSNFERIASSKEEYTRVMTELVDAVSGLDSNIKQSDINSFKNHLNNSFNDSATDFTNLNMKKTVARIVGLNRNSGKGSYKNVMESFVSDRLNGVKYAMYRLISTLDLYRRIATLENTEVLYNSDIPREYKEAYIEMAKRTSVQAHSADYAVKFYDPKNPHPDFKDLSNIELDADGKPIYNYFGKEAGNKVDIPQSYRIFQDEMSLMHGDRMHQETEAILKPKNLLETLREYRKNVVEILGGEFYFIKPEHIATVQTQSTSEQRFLLSGIALDEWLTKIAKQTHNTNKWLKMFGGFGAGLLGVTVLAQFFFGRAKLQDDTAIKNNKLSNNNLKNKVDNHA